MGNGPFLKNVPQKLANSIVQPNVFEENGSGKGSKMAPTIIQSVGNHQARAPGSISCMKCFLRIQKSVSCGGLGTTATVPGWVLRRFVVLSLLRSRPHRLSPGPILTTEPTYRDSFIFWPRRPKYIGIPSYFGLGGSNI